MVTVTPRLRVEAACSRLGRAEFIGRSRRLLAGGAEEPDFIVVLGGQPAVRLLGQGLPEHQAYWLRVWAARGLLWAGPGDAAGLGAALRDDAWRVREMICKVVARHGMGDLLDEVAELEGDPVKRVRIAASRAVRKLVAAGA